MFHAVAPEGSELRWWNKLVCMEADTYVGTHTNILGRFGILNHIEIARENLGVGWLMTSFHH